MKEILFQYGLSDKDFQVQSFGSGLINTTWKITDRLGKAVYILQEINQQVFKSPRDIAYNISLIGQYLKQHFPDYLFVSPVVTVDGEELVEAEGRFYRMFPFVAHSHTLDVVENPQQAYEAAKQFAGFTKRLSGFDAGQLKITLPDFHNLTLRYQQFEQALVTGNPERILEASALVDTIKKNRRIVDEFETNQSAFTIRVTHHDTKISNVLLNQDGQGLCVIDLDTVMPGYFISDAGDMMRTYLSPVSEEEKDFSKIVVRQSFFEAIVNGYLSEMETVMSATEKKYFYFAGEFMIYMQAIRFLTDYLQDDIYYGAKYPSHNFVRAGNQLTLLERLQELKIEQGG